MIIQKARIPVKDVILYAFLPGPLKKFIYRMKGYRLGKKVSIGLGSIVCGKRVFIGDYTKIGFFTIIRGEEISIGSHVSIGSTTFLDTPFLEIGDDSKINEQVFVGGLQYHDSRFVLGKNCQVMQMSFINPTKSIIVGDDSGIGLHCMIFGHTSWQSEFEGYPTEFASIEIGSSVSLTARVFVLPGARIGDGAVVGPNSLVNREIPPRSLAAGYPARVIKKHPDFPNSISDEQKAEIFEKIIKDMLGYFRGSGLELNGENTYFRVTRTKKGFIRKKITTWYLGFEYNDVSDDKSNSFNRKLDVFVSLKRIPIEIRNKLNYKKVMWLDIEKKERPLFWNDLGDEVALFFRRYGVRFTRVKE